MQKHELPELTTRLAQIADALGGRAPSAAGALVWLDALAEFPMPLVLGVLTDWAKHNAKAPVPMEVVKRCRERQADAREDADRARKDSERRGANPFALPGDPNNPAYRAYREAVTAMQREWSGRDGKAWARRLRDREEAGEPLLAAQSVAWRAALREKATTA